MIKIIGQDAKCCPHCNLTIKDKVQFKFTLAVKRPTRLQ